MASSEQVYTHKGWFGICPVWLADIDSDGPTVEARYGLEFLMDFSIWMFGAVAWLMVQIDPAADPKWPFLVTGELHPPKVIRHD